jgi:Ser/Thr protein kinase RdoA (MazF antagonist)
VSALPALETRRVPRRLPRVGRVVHEQRARRRPPPLDVATVDAVLRAYGLATAGGPRVLPLGWRSDNVVVTTPAGPAVVKRYRTRTAAAAIVHEHAITARAWSAGLPVAPPWRTESGATTCTVGDRTYAVAGYVDGVSLSGCHLTPRAAARAHHDAGVLLAAFHSELLGFRPTGRHHLGVHGDGPLADADTAQALEAIERSREESDPAHEAQRWLVTHSDRVGDRIAQLETELAERGPVIGIIHGDYGLHNLTFADHAPPTVHDFELARRDRLLIDVIVVLSRSTVPAGRAFLAGYGAVRELTPADREVLPILWQHYRLTGAVRSWVNHVDQGDDRRLSAARRRVLEADHVAEHGVAPWM